jgi:hypothetical protein
VAVRLRSGENLGSMTVTETLARFDEECSQYAPASVYSQDRP